MEERQNLSRWVLETLTDRILRWEYPPGHRLVEEELCREFGVSRVPVREALQALVENNLAEKVHHRGCWVKQPDLAEIHELYDVRLALELFVVERLVHDSMDEAAWQQLHARWDSEILAAVSADHVNGAPLDSVALAQADESFHEALVEATHNRTLLDLLKLINQRLRFIRSRDITNLERLRQTCTEHVHILYCIRQRDLSAAQDALRANVNGGRAHVEAAIKDALVKAFMGGGD